MSTYKISHPHSAKVESQSQVSMKVKVLSLTENLNFRNRYLKLNYF